MVREKKEKFGQHKKKGFIETVAIVLGVNFHVIIQCTHIKTNVS